WGGWSAYETGDVRLHQAYHDDEAGMIRIVAVQIRGLVNIFNEISMDLNTLPPKASWNHYADAWRGLLKKYLGISPHTDKMELEKSDDLVRAEILAILDRLAGLDSVRANTSLGEFSQTFQHWLERCAVSAPLLNAAGVAALNATAARGQCFRALFILGLNEGVFPRAIREDAFLRDRDRETLERDLGFKVNQKLAGFDEEKLIFTL